MKARLNFGMLVVAFLAVLSEAGAQDRNLLPKYGDGPKPEWQKQADAAFLTASDQEFHGNRTRAADESAMRGWQYLSLGDRDSAMRRFNQAWLLDPKNGKALWGMGAVEASAGQSDESLKLFAEAEPIIGKNLSFSVDYAKAIGKAGVVTKNDLLLNDAYARFAAVQKQAPENVGNLANWVFTLYGAGRYADALAKVKQAEAVAGKAVFDPKFVAELQSHVAPTHE